MFGNDFTRFDKEEKDVKDKLKQKTYENSITENTSSKIENLYPTKKNRNFNYNIKTIFYFSDEDYVMKFLHQFRDLDIPAKFSYTVGMEDISIYGNYNTQIICISLWMLPIKPRFEKMQKMFIKGAYGVLIYFNSDENDFILNVTSLINRIKSDSDAKFILVLDKNNIDAELDAKIKTLQDDNLIQGIYQFTKDETDNNDRLLAEIVKITDFAKTRENLQNN